MRSLLKVLIPSSLRRKLRMRFQRRWFRGTFQSWEEAAASSVGYDDLAVLDRAVQATREVLQGRALWERDGHAFQELEVHTPLMAAFQKVATWSGIPFGVVDFGGGLGSTWRQHQEILGSMGVKRWRIVEQAHFVKAGEEFSSGTLQFHGELEVALDSGDCNAILFSGVLQYLEDPYIVLSMAMNSVVEYIIIDRIPLSLDGCERITVQHTPAMLGGGSYPCWLMSRQHLLDVIKERFDLVNEWQGFDRIDPDVVQYSGMLFRRR